MLQELKFQLSTAILTILTLAAGVAAVVNFGQYNRFRLPDDGIIWVDRASGVVALSVAPGTSGFEIISILLLSNSAQMYNIGCG